MFELLTVTAIALSTLGVTSNSVEWQSDYGKALAASKADSRPLLIVLDNADAIAEVQLTTIDEQPELLNSYERCHVDVSTEYGKRVAEVFKATEFPFAAIIDKTGSIVLCKKSGQITESEWQNTLSTYRSGEKPMPQMQTSFFRGSEGIDTSVTSPSYCPSCQRKAQLGY